MPGLLQGSVDKRLEYAVQFFMLNKEAVVTEVRIYYVYPRVGNMAVKKYLLGYGKYYVG